MGDTNIQLAMKEISMLINMYGPETAPVRYGEDALRFMNLAEKEMSALREENDSLREKAGNQALEIEFLQGKLDAIEAEAAVSLVTAGAETTVLPAGQEPQESLDGGEGVSE